mmetsp:Transcript_30655/g.91738  ORF Transcript_30655/g.91738 Transcript_30655/m.91738 type:complete len:354 (-) Transcript_30655:288-1349(-)
MSNIIRRISNALFEEEDECVYERHWSHSADHEDHQHDTVRPFLFGDAHADTHRFTESAIKRAPKEIACAAAASALVSPLVSVVDRCLVRRAGFAQAATEATRTMVTNPRAFFGGLGFRLTFAVYFGTYAVVNLSELALDVKRCEDEKERRSGKVAATGLANVGLLVWRDSVFARAYSDSAAVTGRGKPTGPKVPVRSMGLFAMRDVGTMYATFYMAPRAADYMVKEHGWDRNAAELSMALTIPAAMQAVTAPLHIHAMDFYANMHVRTFKERFDVILRDWRTVAFARGFRILPAFGLGSFTNNKFREAFIRHEEEEEYESIVPISIQEAGLVVGGGTPMLATSPKSHEEFKKV